MDVAILMYKLVSVLVVLYRTETKKDQHGETSGDHGLRGGGIAVDAHDRLGASAFLLGSVGHDVHDD